MKRLYVPLILLLFVVLEGVALDLLPVQLLNTKTLIVPHWVLIILIFIVIFYDLEDTYYSIIYGIIFGLLIDIVYTGDRKSTRLNSSHVAISYAVFCLKKKRNNFILC